MVSSMIGFFILGVLIGYFCGKLNFGEKSCKCNENDNGFIGDGDCICDVNTGIKREVVDVDVKEKNIEEATQFVKKAVKTSKAKVPSKKKTVPIKRAVPEKKSTKKSKIV